MAAMKDCTILKFFICFQAILVGAQAFDLIAADNSLPELNVTSSLEDYIAQLEQQYAQTISNDEAILAEFRAGYERQLAAIEAQRNFVEIELITADKNFYTLQFLNELSKHCVQKYRALLYGLSAVRQNFNSCISLARSYLNSVLSSADSNVRSLNNLLNSNFKSNIADCKRKNNNSYTNHTICVLNYNNGFSVSFNNLQRTFLSNIDSARCSADTRIRQTVECTFKIVNATISSIGSISSQIDGCINVLESCTPCQDQNGNNNNNGTEIIVPEPQCPNVINVITGAELYRNATIRNPFVGLNSTLDCILVNFLRPA